MGIALFEDSSWQNFLPISNTKAAFDIKIGAKSFFEEYSEIPEVLLTREYLAGVTAERHAECKVNPSSIDSDMVFVNGLLHPGTIDPHLLSRGSHTFAITLGGRLIAARLAKKSIEYLSERVTSSKKIDVRKMDAEKVKELRPEEAHGLLSNSWEIITVLENSLAMQVEKIQSESDLGQGVRVAGSHNIAIARNASVEEGTVLDARKGGICIGPDAYIATSRIVGPAYIGGMTQVKQFSVIESSHIGYNCRVAGEIDHSIISDYTNKSHAGFVGHSYIGEWVNLGAMTTTSDLKMTYGNIKIGTGKSKIDTGHNKIGSFFGDMSKSSIGTLIYSGRRIGVCSHLHGLVAQDVPDFTIYGASIGGKNAELELKSAIETQRKMMSRRNQAMSKAYEQVIEDLFSITANARRLSGVKKVKFTI